MLHSSPKLLSNRERETAVRLWLYRLRRKSHLFKSRSELFREIRQLHSLEFKGDTPPSDLFISKNALELEKQKVLKLPQKSNAGGARNMENRRKSSTTMNGPNKRTHGLRVIKILNTRGKSHTPDWE